MKRALLLLLLVLSLPLTVSADEAQPMAEDPALEKRVMALAENLRCMVCRNETLASSQAPLAVDLRQQIREQMKAGKSDQEILAYMTERWSDYVLFRPPVKATTYLLWLGPFALLVAGIIIQYVYIKRRRAQVKNQPLSEAELKRVETLLGDG